VGLGIQLSVVLKRNGVAAPGRFEAIGKRQRGAEWELMQLARQLIVTDQLVKVFHKADEYHDCRADKSKHEQCHEAVRTDCTQQEHADSMVPKL
jgi:hypothetical protein